MEKLTKEELDLRLEELNEERYLLSVDHEEGVIDNAEYESLLEENDAARAKIKSQLKEFESAEETPKPTHIIVKDTNALRWAVPDRVFVSNILNYNQYTVNFLEREKIGYQLAIKKWGEYEVISG